MRFIYTPSERPEIVRERNAKDVYFRVDVDGRLLGYLTAYCPAVRVYRAMFKPGTKLVYWAVRPNGTKTEFTFFSRKRAAEWLVEAERTEANPLPGASR